MLTFHDVRSQLDVLAEQVLREPGLYDELFSRLFSARVQSWIKTAPKGDADLIRRIAERDPDYRSTIELITTTAIAAEPLLNPDWDVDY